MLNPSKFCSVHKNFEDLENLLQATNKYFDAIAINESRIISYANLSTNITQTTTLMNLHKLSDKLRQDLCIYKLNDLEPIFVETINPKQQISSLVVYIDMNLMITTETYYYRKSQKKNNFFVILM